MGAAALVEVAGYRNADALVHVVRAFRDPSVPHPSGSVDPARDAQAMEDELILADLGVVERRLERLEKDSRRAGRADLETERALLLRCQPALESGQPLRALGLAGDDGSGCAVPAAVGQAAAGGHQPRRGGRRRSGQRRGGRRSARG